MMKTKRLSPVAVTSIVLGVIVAICLIFGIGTYNSLAKQNQAVEAQWSQVENVMQRRADLVPNLVNAVKGQMGQEQKFSAILLKPGSLTLTLTQQPARLKPMIN